MTKVTKLLGGSFVAVLGIVLLAAFAGLFNFDSGTTAATPNFDRASAHVIGAADLAPASLAAAPTHYLPGDINATSRIASAAGPSNPLNALPVSLTRAVDSLAGSLSPFYGSLSPGLSVSSLPMASDANDPNVKGTNNSIPNLSSLVRYMTINTINVSRAPATDLANGVESDDPAGTTNTYSLNTRWSLATWAGTGVNNIGLVKDTDISGMNPDARTSTIVTAIYAYDDAANRLTQVFPTAGSDASFATMKVTLSANQAYWIATTNDPTAKGIRFGNLAWADTVDHYTAAVQLARGETVQIADSPIPAIVADGGLVLDNGNMYSKALGVHALDSVVGSKVGSGTITAPFDYPKAPTALINKLASWKNYQLNAVNLTNAAHFRATAFDGDVGRTAVTYGATTGSTSTASTPTWLMDGGNAVYAIADPAFVGILGITALLAIFATLLVSMWTSGGFSATNHRAARALGAG